MEDRFGYIRAIEDFRRERNAAALQTIMGRLTGKPVDLLSFDEISRKLHVAGGADRGLKDIPISAIVGSVSRYSDFTRSFLPLHDYDMTRWARVKAAVDNGEAGLPPIEVYQIGDAYFVKDGHHRVSVARRLGAKYIEAYINEIKTKVPLTADIQPDELILKEEYADFLEKTHFDDLVPDDELRLTVPGFYDVLLNHIDVHRYYMGIEQEREIPYPEAVLHWYHEVYIPVKQAILERGILREFPGRTVTDLYIWINEHRYLLEQELGWQIRPEVAATSLAKRLSPRGKRVFQRALGRIRNWLVPDVFADAPAAGAWRKERSDLEECLFRDILVPLSGEDDSWAAFDQALAFPHCEGIRLNGLHVVAGKTALEMEQVEAIRSEYDERCQKAGVEGSLAIVEGEISLQICERALLGDLVVLNLAHPPSTHLIDRLGSGFRTIIRRCARPILAVPGQSAQIKRLLLAYDDSPKAREALYISAYLAGRWSLPLVVLTTEDGVEPKSKVFTSVERYLKQHRVRAKYVKPEGDIAQSILKVAEAEKSSLILMGGYGLNPVLEAVLGSTVDGVLRETQIPVLICQ